MKAIYWRLFMARLALRWVFSVNLGREVLFDGQRWTLVQGVRAPIWSLVNESGARVDVHEKDFRLVLSPRNCWRAFIRGYRFYRTSWYSIWMRDGIKPWMVGCRIWQGKPPRVRACDS